MTPSPAGVASRRPRTVGALAVAGGLVVAWVTVASTLPVRALDGLPTSAIAPVGAVPNAFYHGPNDGFSPKVGMLADPANHLLFEYQPNNNTCPFVLDSDTYQVKARGSGASCTAFAGVNQTTSISLGVAATVDPVDHVVIATDNQRDTGATLGAVGLGEIHVLAESDLHTLKTWSLPAVGDPRTSPQKQIAGVSWYAPLDELLVLTGNFGNGGVLPGVSVSAYAMAPSLKSGSPVVAWTEQIPQCQAAFIPNFASAAAYHASHEADLYVPCVLLAPNPVQLIPQSNERDGVVKVPMTTTGCAAPATECPNVSAAQVAVAPGVSSDTVFDPGADRVFMISGAGGFVSNSAVLSIMVYSGHLNAFLGAAVVGGSADVSSTAAGFDTDTGRFYVVNTRGLSIVDSRRTPVTPGSIFGAYAESVSPPTVFPVLPPDVAHPYTRIIVNNDRVASNGVEYMPSFTVFGDTLPVSVDPPADVVDARTIQGAIPPGAQLQKTVGGSARGYGWHNDLVGGPDDLANAADDLNAITENFANTTINLPLGKGNRDLLGGAVQELNLRTDGVDGAADALGAADDSTAYNVQQCTDVQQLVNCAQPPAAPPVGLPSGVSQPTGQLMPFPAATCSQPGSDADRGATVDGAYYTTWSQDPHNAGQWDPQQHQAPGSDQTQAHATVSCVGAAAATSWLRAGQISATGGPSFSVADATTTSQVQPPAADGSVTSTVSAVAQGVDIDLADASGPVSHISIASVSQTATTTAGGRPGTARASDLAVISGVSVDGAPLCTTQCDPSTVAAVLNQQFPTLLHVEVPQADGSFMTSCVVESDGQRDCSGSPGGYKASVEANLVEQLGDHDFNGMTTNEATLLPALRLIFYFPNDGNPARTRDVLDLAGVASTSTLGISTLPNIAPFLDSGLEQQAFAAAAGVPPTSVYVPGTPGGLVPAAGTAQSQYSGGPLGVVERAFNGLLWMVRSPLGALQMVGYLAALAVPIVLARRRRGLSAP